MEVGSLNGRVYQHTLISARYLAGIGFLTLVCECVEYDDASFDPGKHQLRGSRGSLEVEQMELLHSSGRTQDSQAAVGQRGHSNASQ